MPAANEQPTHMPEPHRDDDIVLAEKAILGTFLLASSAVADAQALLDPDDFNYTAHRRIFRAAINLYAQGAQIEPIALYTEAERLHQPNERHVALHDIAALEQCVISPGNLRHHAGLVRAFARKRRLTTLGFRTGHKANSTEPDEIRDLLLETEGKLFELLQDREDRPFLSARDIAETVNADVIRRHDEDRDTFTGLRTHFARLDQLLGGLRAEYIVLAARTSVGKTALALNIAVHVASTPIKNDPANLHGVAIFSLEMGREAIMERMICSKARIPGHLVRMNRMTGAQVQQFHDEANNLAQLPIWINDTPALGPTEIRMLAQRLQIRHPNLSLVIIDYLGLMAIRDRDYRGNRQQEVSDISRAIKALARDLNLPVLCLHQLSRQIETRSAKNARPRLSDLRESGAIEQDADAVLFIHRIEPYKPKEGPPQDKPIPCELIVGKQRNGPTGVVRLLFKPDVTRFVEEARPTEGAPPDKLPF